MSARSDSVQSAVPAVVLGFFALGAHQATTAHEAQLALYEACQSTDCPDRVLSYADQAYLATYRGKAWEEGDALQRSASSHRSSASGVAAFISTGREARRLSRRPRLVVMRSRRCPGVVIRAFDLRRLLEGAPAMTDKDIVAWHGGIIAIVHYLEAQGRKPQPEPDRPNDNEMPGEKPDE